MSRFTYFIAFLMFAHNVALANTGDTHHGKLWANFQNFGYVDRAKQFDYELEAQARFQSHKAALEESIGKIALGHQLNPKNHLWIAYATHNKVPSGMTSPNHEHRLQQQLNTLWKKRSSYKSSWRFRLEERKRLGEPQWAIRFRTALKYEFKLTTDESVRPILSDEIFVYLHHTDWTTKTFVDQNRLLLGVKKILSKKTYAKFGYMNQYLFGSSNTMNHILVLSFVIDSR